ncbi:unnamed protein product [Boreogadus saida]
MGFQSQFVVELREHSGRFPNHWPQEGRCGLGRSEEGKMKWLTAGAHVHSRGFSCPYNSGQWLDERGEPGEE